MKVIFDANVVLSGAGWRAESHGCLVKLARRQIIAFASVWMIEELLEAAGAMQRQGAFKKHSPWPILTWYQEAVRIVTPTPLGKQRSRDAKDDPYLACALSAQADYIVSFDEDLLALEKPFGIEIIRPRELLRRLAQPI